MSGGELEWSEAARALFRLDRPTAVSAGAGSGKTTCLVELCSRLLSGEATGAALEPAQIVAITFTEKAAQELEERLRAALAARAGAAPAGSAEARRWLDRLHALDGMAIGTIHGFATRLLREHALEAGVDPEQTVIDEDGAAEWRLEASKAAVVAAADSGDPDVLALCSAHGAAGRRGGVAGIVAELLRERASRGLRGPPDPVPPPLGAALAARRDLLASAGALLERRAQVRTASGTAALERLAAAVAALSAADRDGPLSADGVAALETLSEALKGWRLGKSDGEALRDARDAFVTAAERFPPLAGDVLAAPQLRALCAIASDAAARYAARKAGSAARDFDDLLLAARDLLRGVPAVRETLRRRLRAVLVDEYQDVNGVQQELFELLAGGDDGPVLVAVGDLKQSIYGFRGADVAVFRDLLERFEDGIGARVLHLPENHRSTPGVIAVVNEVSARAMQPVGADPRRYELRFRDADRLVARRPASSGGAAAEILVDSGDGGAEARREREAAAIAERIRALVSGDAGAAVWRRDERRGEVPHRPSFGDVAILFRRLTRMAPYERALREAGIPYRLARGGGFYQAPEVRDLAELVASIVEPSDAVAWAAVLRSPFCGVSDGTLFLLAQEGLAAIGDRDPERLARALEDRWATAAGTSGAAGEDIERLRRLLAEWHALRAVRDRVPVAELLQRAVDHLDLEGRHLAAPGGERRVANVRKTLAIARRFAAGGGTASAFARRLRTLAAKPPREPEADLEAGDAIAVLSVHQAKGLEWPIVFVPDLGAPPRSDSRRAMLAADGSACAAFWDGQRETFLDGASMKGARAEAARATAAESRRLLYVALTRARDRLVLSGETGRNGDSWRSLIDGALTGRGDLAVRIPFEEARSFRVGDHDLAPTAAAAAPAIATAPPTAAAAATTTAPVVAPRVPVTLLAEYARCPRRPWLARAGVLERAASQSASDDDSGRATARGTLAHVLLAEVDLAAPATSLPARLAAAAARHGHDPAARGVRRILDDVLRFATSPGGRQLGVHARAGALRREVPFLLRVGDGERACYLAGAIDAIVETPEGILIVDYKYALPRRGAVERWRPQLLAYCLAAARATGGRPVTARIQFLRGACTGVEFAPTAQELASFASAAPSLAAAAAAGEEPPEPAELGRTLETCVADVCGFAAACHRTRAR